MHRKLGTLALALLSVTALAACGSASTSSTSSTSTPGKTKISLMVGGLNKQIYLPFMLAKQLGYYDKYGVDVQLSDEPAGVEAETAMLSGQVDGVGGFYDHTVDLQTKGKATESVVQLLQTPGEVELCRSDLKDTIK